MVLTVTPVLQLGWVGIDLIDSDVIILTYVASSLACCCWLAVGWQNSNRDLAANTLPTAMFSLSVSCSEKQERRGEDDCPGYIPMYP
jgi:hypothetical protein